MLKKVYTVFVDTKMSSQNPSMFQVTLPDYFIRTGIKNDYYQDNEWYISIKSCAMLNSFKNITKDINDSIIVYEYNGQADIDDSEIYTDTIEPELFTTTSIRLKEGNPNVTELESHFNDIMLSYNVLAIYNSYDSTYTFTVRLASTKKLYICFDTSHEMFGMDKNRLYPIYKKNKTFESVRNVNLLADRLLKFHIDNNKSDFRILNSNYSNLDINSENFTNSMLFFMLPIYVNPYELIYYERKTEEKIPIQLNKNAINSFQINITNQDNTFVEGLADYLMVIEFIHIKRDKNLKKLLELVRQIYMWVGTYISRKII